MAKWESTLHLGDVYHAGLAIPELAGIVAERLAALSIANVAFAEERNFLAADFRELALDDRADADDFDEIMERLYNWADTTLSTTWPMRKLCWIDTLTPKVSA